MSKSKHPLSLQVLLAELICELCELNPHESDGRCGGDGATSGPPSAPAFEISSCVIRWLTDRASGDSGG